MVKEKESELNIAEEHKEVSEEPERVTPDVEADFMGLLKDYGVGEKPAKIITKHIAETGTANVFEDARELLEKMAKFPRHIPPVTRKNILDHWTATRNIPVPEGFEEEVELPAEELKLRKKPRGEPEKYSVDKSTGDITVATTTDKNPLTWDEAEKLSDKIKKDIEAREKKEAEGEKGEKEPPFITDGEGKWIPNPKAKMTGMDILAYNALTKAQEKGETRNSSEPEKYSVDKSTGDITVASTTDKNPLTWDEAEKLSTKIKKDIEAREKKEAKAGEGDKEPPFITDSEGNWIPNPKAKMTGMDILAYNALTKAQEKGETRNPFEILKDEAKDIEIMRSVFGTGKEGGQLFDSIEDLLKLKSLLGADEDTKALLSGIYKFLKEGGEGTGESEEVKALSEKLDKLTAELQRKELEKRDDQITGLTNELSGLKGQVAKAMTEARAKDEYGIMSEGLKVVDRRLGAMESALQGVFGKRSPPLGEVEKKELTKAISEEARAEEELDSLAEKVFYEHS